LIKILLSSFALSELERFAFLTAIRLIIRNDCVADSFTNEKLQATFNQALRTPEASARTPPLPKNPPLLQAVFQAAMEENAEEDVHVEVADMSEIDNQEVLFLLIRVSLCHGGSPHEYARACQVLELIEGKPGGILSILNEECVVPKGSDASFADKMFQVR
jgi:hypothetical protein